MRLSPKSRVVSSAKRILDSRPLSPRTRIQERYSLVQASLTVGHCLDILRSNLLEELGVIGAITSK